MGIFTKCKASQGCVMVVGVEVEQLSQAILSKVHQDSLILYQVNHVEAVATPQFRQEQGFIAVNANLLAVDAVKQVFHLIEKAGHQVELLIFQPQAPVPINTVDLTEQYLQSRWQLTGISSIHIAQTAIKKMLLVKRGTVIFLGSVHAISPSAGWLADSALQAGIRALSQSLAREFQPQGIHISYVVLNQWSTDNSETAQAIASTCWNVHQQHDSAWSQELTVY
jgi:short-subunit dehydrogenase